jgi:chloramphenicol 3-O-phosphotransferase
VADLVFIYGPAAAGKLTTARALGDLTGLPVFHNHLVVNAVVAVFPFGSNEFVRLRDEFWMSTFAAAAATNRSLIFTFAPERTVPLDFADRVQACMAADGGRVHFVRLTVSDAERERRIENPDRRASGKLASLVTLRAIVADDAANPWVAPRIPADLVLDTDASSAAENAGVIRDELRLTSGAPHRPFP